MNEAEREWAERANHDPDQDIDWRAAQRDRADLDRYAARLPKPTAAQWATLNQNPWATL